MLSLVIDAIKMHCQILNSSHLVYFKLWSVDHLNNIYGMSHFGFGYIYQPVQVGFFEK